jgi:ligand-binding sensor domain-containing protein/signal transduction histidine kinase
MRMGEFVRIVLSAIALCLAVITLHAIPQVWAQQLAIRRYDLRDGLAHSRVIAIHQDRKGYLWFGTWEGLSRFDGYRFTNYSTGEGLGNSVINAITEDRQGGLWVATNGGGVARLINDPGESLLRPSESGTPRRKFESFSVGDSHESNRVNAMLFDSGNNCWCATDDGLYRRAADQGNVLKFELIVPHAPVADFMAAFEDSRGRLWFGITGELIEVVRGEIIKYGAADEVGYPAITSIVEDHRGRLILGNTHGVFEFIEPADFRARGRWARFPVLLEPGQVVRQMLADSNGALWIGTQKGLIKYKDSQKLYTTTHGLSDDNISALDEDRDGNVWIGTWTGGVCKLSGEAIVSYTRSEGLPDQFVVRIIEDNKGRVYATTIRGGVVEILEGKAVPIPGSQATPFTDVGTRILQDRRGDWWIGTNHGLFRLEGPELQVRRSTRSTAADGIADEDIHDIYEDPDARVWISAGNRNLYCFDPAKSGRALFKRIPLETTQPTDSVGWMVSDRSGALWLGGRFGLLARLKNETVRPVEPAGGLPEKDPRALFVDSRGWLWIGLRSRGVSVTKDPTAEHPAFFNYSTATGLASDYVSSIAEDNAGRIYLATFKGLDRLDPFTGEIHHFTTRDGLAGDVIDDCIKDRRGNIWVATSTGLSRLDPRAEHALTHPPDIFLSRVQVGGEDLPLPETGALRMSTPELSASRNDVLIEYVGLSFQSEGELRYRYQLEGANTDWSTATEQRSVNYARLASGSYRFMVRAITRQGIASEPAVFEFRILPPVWQRWWFVSLITLFIAAVIYVLYRYRLRRLIELERVRTRIASDLHDDIGSNLSLIAGLSEVLRQQSHPVDPQMAERLSVIARISRRSVDAMSDIVWAVNPKRDSLLDLSHRMRRFASDSFTARDIEFHFDAPSLQQNVKVGAEVRRELFLIFKEGVNNIVRHSGCKTAEVALQIDHRMINLTLSDNGKGFDGAVTDVGQGLISMRRRAKKLGGELVIISQAGEGTTVIVKAPVGHQVLKSLL